MAPVSTAGRLLVATPPLVDPNFDRAVVYVVDHDHAGAVGVILNRPDDATLPEALDRWTQLLAEPTVLFRGGPVAPEALLALGLARDGTDQEQLIVGRMRSVDLSSDPTLLTAELRGLRVFSGYSGWGPGQLDGEIASGAWIVADANDNDLVDPTPDTLWRRVLARQTGRLAWLASVPDDLSAN
jgi:putative transcriptional regulator